MKLTCPPFKVCEEILDYIIKYHQDTGLDQNKLERAIGKSKAYFNKAVVFLKEIEILNVNHLAQNLGAASAPHISLNSQIIDELTVATNSQEFLQSHILNLPVLKEFAELLSEGKTEKQAIKYVIAHHHIELNQTELIETIKKYISYTQKKNGTKVNSVESGFLLINSKGKLEFKKAEPISIIESSIENAESALGEGKVFVDLSRINELNSITKPDFDLLKLIQFCKELNFNFACQNYLSVGMLTRAIIDHVPPIFGKSNFTEVYGSYGTKSFKESMRNLDKSSRKISDSFLHSHIRRKEVLPNRIQVNFSNELDVLLSEIYRILK